MFQIIFNDIVVEVIRKRIKNLYLTVHRTSNQIRLTAPIKSNEEFLKIFIGSKIPWIRRQLEKSSAYKQNSFYNYVTGEYHYFQGDRYLLNVIDHHKSGVILREESIMDLYVPKKGNNQVRKQIMEKWYRLELKHKMIPLINKWQAITGVQATEYYIKRMKTRWGTCNIKARRIWLNLELIKKPVHCLEYVIVHEQVHLLEKNHNKRFTAYMDSFMPQWRMYKKELNQF